MQAGQGVTPRDDAGAIALPAHFLGEWLIERHILDVDSQWLGRFDGTALFTRTNDGLHYLEEGRLRFGGLDAIKASRVYQWRFPGGARIEVLFEDGRAFHGFDFGRARVTASHYCDPDQYDVTYDFESWPLWRAEWRVEGPRKDYRMVSIYRRNAPL